MMVASMTIHLQKGTQDQRNMTPRSPQHQQQMNSKRDCCEYVGAREQRI